MSTRSMAPIRTSFVADAARFLVAGGLNTLLTLAVYQVLLFAMPPSAAYAISWVVGIVFVMLVYPSKVFPEGRSGLGDRVALGASYAIVFLLGLALLELLTRNGIHPRFSILIVMGFTTVVGLFSSRFLLRRE